MEEHIWCGFYYNFTGFSPHSWTNSTSLAQTLKYDLGNDRQSHSWHVNELLLYGLRQVPSRQVCRDTETLESPEL